MKESPALPDLLSSLILFRPHHLYAPFLPVDPILYPFPYCYPIVILLFLILLILILLIHLRLGLHRLSLAAGGFA